MNIVGYLREENHDFKKWENGCGEEYQALTFGVGRTIGLEQNIIKSKKV